MATNSYSMLKIPVQLFMAMYGFLSLIVYAAAMYMLTYYLPQITWLASSQIVFSYILFTILYVAGIFVFGGYYYVLISIAPKMASEFDSIRNDIAARRIKTVDDFTQRIVDFIPPFFNYAFFDIEYAFIKVNSHKVTFSDALLPQHISIDTLEQITKEAMESEDVFYLGNTKIDKRKFHTYIIPIYFEEEYHGYIGILAKSKLNIMYRQILSDFEDNYIDDQLVNVMNM